MSLSASVQPAPRISIVVIFLNPGVFIEEAIGSVLVQSFPDWELILVDDGSTDQSTEIALQAAQAHPDRIRYIEHPGHVNLGTSASRDVGLRDARGEYLLYLDADDVLFVEALARMHALAESTKDVAAVFGTTLWWNWVPAFFANKPDGVQSYGRWRGVIRAPRLLSAMVTDENLHPANCSSLLRTSVIRDIGGFEPEFRGMYEDTVLLAKLLLGHNVLLTDESYSAYRMHPASQCHRAAAEGNYDHFKPNESRGKYLRWLKRYIKAKGANDPRLHYAVARELWAYDRPRLYRLFNSYKVRAVLRAARTLADRLQGRSPTAPAVIVAQARLDLSRALEAQNRSPA